MLDVRCSIGRLEERFQSSYEKPSERIEGRLTLGAVRNMSSALTSLYFRWLPFLEISLRGDAARSSPVSDNVESVPQDPSVGKFRNDAKNKK